MIYPIQKCIQSVRLSLSVLASSELELYQRLHADPVTMQYIGPCYEKEQSAVFFKNCLKKTEKADSGWHFFAIQLTGQTDAIGFISLIAKPFVEAPYELGIILSATARGLGYADEALTALFLHCFTDAKVPALLACVDPRNLGAVKHIKHFGFVDAPAALKKSAELNSYLLHATADNISYLRTLSQQFSEQQFDKPQPALAEA
ncbi:N-acetyltransferase [Rheinheimera riviphila]|uniref:N-acetyltransferase n=1 Tax=Rheinheimera riviphila TaxID=1834037 RepID=A0A437QFU4_9GAMM|nr:GNAT family N-acetyltransferase [Rheinheimera riviphila]RVU33382.1 N-acetyltransferase [Rheinheimera riviphila]